VQAGDEMTMHKAIHVGFLALAVASLACERAEPTHNSGHQPTDKPSSPTTLQRVDPQIDKQRNNAGARAGLPRPADEDATDAPSTPPSTATSDTKQSAGPSAAGRTQTSPADAAREPAQ
jgi:hypothetical protein